MRIFHRAALLALLLLATPAYAEVAPCYLTPTATPEHHGNVPPLALQIALHSTPRPYTQQSLL